MRHVAFRFGNGLPTLVWGPWGGPLLPASHAHRRIGLESTLRHEVSRLEQELETAKAALRQQLSAAGAAQSALQMALATAEELRSRRASEHRSEVKAAQALAMAAQSKAANEIVRERAKIDHELRAAMLKIASMERKLAGREFVDRSVHEGMQHRYDYKIAAVQTQLDHTAALYAAAREREMAREREERGEEE